MVLEEGTWVLEKTLENLSVISGTTPQATTSHVDFHLFGDDAGGGWDDHRYVVNLSSGGHIRSLCLDRGLGSNIERCGCHLVRFKKLFLEILFQRQAGHFLNSQAGNVDSYAVGPAGAGLELQRAIPDLLKLCCVSIGKQW